MANFNDEAKKELSKFLPEGVHKIKITNVISANTPDMKEYFEFTVEDAEGYQSIIRIWWTTEKALNYSFNTIRDIFVHNTVEKNRDLIREKINGTKNTAELLKLCKENLVGKEAWVKIEKSGTYENADGETKNSYSKNIYGYEPKMSVKKDDDILASGKPIDLSEIPFN